MTERRRTGRPPGSAGNQRETILAAARELFADNGFRGTTMRAVAARAGVDVALVPHYFGNKQALFAAALELPEGARTAMLGAMAAPHGQRGEALTRAYLGLWEAPETGEQFRVVTRAALGSRELGRRMEGVVAEILTGAVTTQADRATRALTEAAWTQLLGVAIARYLLQVPTVASMPLDALIDLVAPGIQATLDAVVPEASQDPGGVS